MCPCTPLDDASFNLPNPAAGTPGFGGFAIPIPDLNIPFLPLPLEDLQGLFDALSLILPAGTLKPHLETDFLKDVLGAIYSLLEKFTPFLMLYKFFLPVLNLILCIIEVLCAIPNPFKLIRALRRLFRVCIPEFLALFPYFALIIMIISLLLLILALIEYLINRIIQIIKLIIQNIRTLILSTARLDNDSIVAIVKKIGDLLCLLQNLFVLFGVFALIIQLIKTMLNLNFRIPPCDSSDGGQDGCCTPDVCPAFIKNNTTINSTTGNFLYFNEVGLDSGLILPAGFPPIVSVVRPESWQFYDPNLVQNQAFINITKAFDLPPGLNTIFFPSGAQYNKKTSPSSTPYTINFRILYDPAAYNATDPRGKRYIKIVNAIVQSPPTAGVSSYNTTLIAPFNGTLNLVGGVVTEDDGSPILDSQGSTVPLNDFLHNSINAFGQIPGPTDAVAYSNVEYAFTINHEILVANSLITLGCVPAVAADRDFINTTLGAQFNLNGEKLAEIAALLPDMTAAQECVLNAVNTLRQNISPTTVDTFQTNVLDCLNNLKATTTTALGAAVGAGFDQYKSTFTVDPEIQFTTNPITLTVSLNESSGNLMTKNLPSDAAQTIASQLEADVTLGNVSSFLYDGSQFFTAEITSNVAGNGTVKVAFNHNFISTLNNPTTIDQAASVTVTILPYTFVQSPAAGIAEPRRDEGDVSRDGQIGNNGA